MSSTATILIITLIGCCLVGYCFGAPVVPPQRVLYASQTGIYGYIRNNTAVPEFRDDEDRESIRNPSYSDNDLIVRLPDSGSLPHYVWMSVINRHWNVIFYAQMVRLAFICGSFSHF